MSDEPKRLLITPPPGLLPPVPASGDDAEPVNTGSATRRIGSPQPPAPTFFPTVPGLPPAGATRPVPGEGEPVADQGAPAAASAPARAGTWSIELPDGSQHTVPAAGVVLGRNPVAPRSWPGAAPIAVDDPDKTVSKSHAVVVPAGDGITVIDLKSTNGTALVDAGRTRAVAGDVAVDHPVTLVLGSFAVQLGRS